MVSQVETAITQYRNALLSGDAKALARMAEAFSGLEQTLTARLDELVKIATAHGELTNGQWMRLERVVSLLDDVVAEIDAIAAQQTRFVEIAQRGAAQLARGHALAMIAAQAGSQAQVASIVAAFNRLNAGAVVSISGRMSNGSPLRALFDSLGEESSALIQKTLTEGIGLGANPNELGRILAKNVTDLTTWKAQQWSRDALIASYQDASTQHYKANADLLSGKRWTCAKQAGRTCLACLSRDGDIYPLDAVMDRHSRCRCSWCPVLKGGDLPIQSGRDWFDGLPEKDVRKWGGAVFDAIQDGATLDDFVVTRESKAWGRSVHQTSARRALMRADRTAAPKRPTKTVVGVDDPETLATLRERDWRASA